jgi:hypothetical protein
MIKTIMKNKAMMKKIILSVMLLISAASWAELPSWGLTENQYKLPNFSSKMSEIGAQAAKNNWMLKVTAPNDWHKVIRNALTKTGERDVQVTFKDSVYQSIAITAVPGAKIAQISPSTSNGSPVQKQVVMDKPEIDTAVEAPDFGDTNFNNNTSELLEDIGNIEMTLPTAQVKTPTPAEVNTQTQATVSTQQPKPATVPAAPQTQTQSAAAVVPTINNSNASIEDTKESLRMRHARTKRVDKLLSYSNINSKDELFIEGQVVLVKRFINQGVVLFFWMQELYDPAIHKLVEKGSGKYQKDPEALAGESPDKAREVVKVVESIQPTNLDFIAVDSVVEDQDDLRRDNIRNKRVDYSISADQLKEDDILYIQNQTVLVERPITSTQSAYFWLVGDTTINREVERKGDHKFVIK